MPGKVVSPEEWLTARKTLLVKEQAAARAHQALHSELRDFPMVKITKPYTFTGPNGTVPLSDLFQKNKQLIVYHFMLGPGQKNVCTGCSFMVDNFPLDLVHLTERGATLVVVSRAPLEEISKFKERMGWDIPWYSSFGTDFNYDYHVTLDEDVAPLLYNYEPKETMKAPRKGDMPGLSVFLKDDEGIYHTYSAYGESLEIFNPTHRLLEVTPFGREEADSVDWKHHDEY